MIVAALALSACDNKVNQDFEQSVKDRKAADAGDPYVSLEQSVPSLRRYVQTEKIQQRDFAEGQSGQFRATYDDLLSKLDEDKEVDRSSTLFKACRPAFASASRFQSGGGNDESAAADAGVPLRRQGGRGARRIVRAVCFNRDRDDRRKGGRPGGRRPRRRDLARGRSVRLRRQAGLRTQREEPSRLLIKLSRPRIRAFSLR